jgi:hypothetical protein
MKITDIKPGQKISVQRPGHAGKVIVYVESVDPARNRWGGRDGSGRLIFGNAKNANPA